MAKKELITYIQQLKDNKYSLPAIRAQLVRAGYNQQEIADAVNEAYHAVPKGRVARPVIIGGLAVVGAILLILAIMVLVSPSQKISLKVLPSTIEVYQGGMLVFEDIITNKGRKEGYKISIRHDVLDPASGGLVVTDTTTAILEDRVVKSTRIDLPEVQPGRYLLKTTASFNGKTEESSFTFRVLQSLAPVIEAPTQIPTPTGPIDEVRLEPTCPGGCDDFDSCTIDSCVDGVCKNNEISPCCGNFVCEDGETTVSCAQDCAELPKTKTSSEIIRDAEQAGDAEKAARLCSSLPKITDSDNCFSSVAEQRKDKGFCERINDETKKNNCYMGFALTLNDFTVCEKITNTYLQKSCFSLKNLRALQEASAQAS